MFSQWDYWKFPAHLPQGSPPSLPPSPPPILLHRTSKPRCLGEAHRERHPAKSAKKHRPACVTEFRISSPPTSHPHKNSGAPPGPGPVLQDLGRAQRWTDTSLGPGPAPLLSFAVVFPSLSSPPTASIRSPRPLPPFSRPAPTWQAVSGAPAPPLHPSRQRPFMAAQPWDGGGGESRGPLPAAARPVPSPDSPVLPPPRGHSPPPPPTARSSRHAHPAALGSVGANRRPFPCWQAVALTYPTASP